MNNQEAFNKMAIHLMTQQEKSEYDEDDNDCPSCHYKHPVEPLMCTVGVLIPDEEYNITLEGNAVQYLVKVLKLSCLAGINERLLEDMQSLHDNSEVEDWKNKLLTLAILYGLDSTILDQFS